ncbi:response regulator transcription factor [Pantoea rwandensis]|uniref:DNA-binding response regulator n=1 Tax=Pantoea rwandensis TaxID=1076550 RepID=A0A1X1D533_9GAMM|nr:response regulator [Pantoea rwandensis]ORM71802.1 DNA-binding response regulator [Pantoea rwandensis]
MNPIIYIVDDDPAVRSSLCSLLHSEDYQVQDFSTPEAFLVAARNDVPSCLILDLNMPGNDGLLVIDKMNTLMMHIPTVFLTGFGTIPATVRAMKAGAFEFLTKPADPERLLNVVAEALQLSQSSLSQQQELHELTQRYKSLTVREREVMELTIKGLMIKQIAMEMSVSEITVKVHKRNLMDKMKSRTVSDLVRASERLVLVRAQQ